MQNQSTRLFFPPSKLSFFYLFVKFHDIATNYEDSKKKKKLCLHFCYDGE